jgi:hypothetical protein
MTQNLSKYVNKTILVSIPSLSGDVKCRPYKLTGVELVGLWLQSEQLASEFLAHDQKAQTQMTWAFFVPYSQIACVAVGAVAPAVAAGGEPLSGLVAASGEPRKKTKASK